jgi:hypothetical protein
LIDKRNLVRFEARRSQAPIGQEEPLPPVTIADLLRQRSVTGRIGFW